MQLAVTAPPPAPSLIEPTVETLIKATGIDFRIGGNRAYYMPSQNYVQVPPPQAYFEPINWHRTALHELGHVSGAPHRMNIPSPTGEGFRDTAQAGARRPLGRQRECTASRSPHTRSPLSFQLPKRS